MYNDDEIQNNNHGSKQTVHTLKGRFNEEAQRLVKCGNIEENTKNTTKIAPTYKESQIIQSIDQKNDKGVDIADLEMKVLAEMLKDFEDHPLRLEGEPEKIVYNNTDSHPNDYVVDKTNKQFEFESLLIKNEAANMFRYTDDEDDDDDNEDSNNTISNVKNNTRRVHPYDLNQAQIPRNYLNPFENPPQRSQIQSPVTNVDLNRKVVKANNPNNLNNPNTLNNLNNLNYNYNPKPILSDVNKEISPLNVARETTTISNDIASEYKSNTLKQDIGDMDIDLFSHLNHKFSSEELRNITGDPTKGFGISDMVRSNLMLIDHPRVCYACSSTVSPSCWSPDRRTPTKYCRQDHNACLTKVYRHKGISFIIRDCGNACLNNNLAEYGIRYKSCTICHSDLCNGAYSVQIYARNIIVVLIISLFFK
ncbi:glycosyltransferase-like protein gnt13, partial [Zerene cesonia]|uniref:glycosyltransferase-like protein gnt13 n=1 Tax=Zerene cesonia TaxID=33412 RepID=UPI0018E568D8